MCWDTNFEHPDCQVGEEEVIVEPGDQISPSVARAALARVAEEASRQPMLVRRLARKHQVNSIALVSSLYHNYISPAIIWLAESSQEGTAGSCIILHLVSR